MRTFASIIFILIQISLYGNNEEKSVNSNIHQVTVFEKGAQVSRTASTRIQAGNSIIKLVDIAPHILSSSIQVKGTGDFTILSVKYRQNYLNKSKLSTEMTSIQTQQDSLSLMIEDKQTALIVLKEEYSLIITNKDIGGNDGVNLNELKATSEFYQSRLKEIKLEELRINREIKDINEVLQDLVAQKQNISRSFKDYTSEIILAIESERETKAEFTFSYLVQNAGWFANYDARVKDVNSPVELMYKGKVYQSSGEDWNNVNLTLSTGNPQENATKPILQPWWIGYYQNNYSNRSQYTPGVYAGQAWNGLNRTVTGIVTDGNGEAMIGASVMIKGFSVGTTADIDGRYSINVPQGANTLLVSYVGYNDMETQITSNNINLVLEENSHLLSEVVVSGYGSKLKNPIRSLQGRVAGIKIEEEAKDINLSEVDNTTSIEFKIKNPYSIPSDGQQYTVQIMEHEIPAEYEYYCAPKINDDAFLTAEITDWKDLHLQTGELNIFFKDTYLGKSMLDANNVSDTLSISLGTDKDIVVQRTKIKDMSKRRIIGLKKIETRSWDIEILNKKSQDIRIVIEDQFPISKNEEIVVEKTNYKGAELDEDTGILVWNHNLKAGENKKSNFSYSIKYNKRKYIALE